MQLVNTAKRYGGNGTFNKQGLCGVAVYVNNELTCTLFQPPHYANPSQASTPHSRCLLNVSFLPYVFAY